MSCQKCLGLLTRQICFALIGLPVMAWSIVQASDAVPAAGGAAVPQPAQADFTPGVQLLVLSNGRMVDGKISQNAGGFVVDKPTGSMLVPFDYVKFVADDRDDAYQKMRKMSAGPTAQSHMALARWCITNQYFKEAAAELREALHIDPNRDDARRMLRRLEELFRPAIPKHQSVAPNEDWLAGGFDAPDAESLARLNPETAHEYVSRVQPLLMNKCATSGCHGSSAAGGFELQRVRFGRGSARVASERNLAALKEFIDPGDADNSPLLTVPLGNHGRGGRPIFHGASGSEQIELLKKWVRRMAADLSHGERKDHQKPSFPRTTRSLADKAAQPKITPASAQIPAAARSENPIVPAAASSQAADQDARLRLLLRKTHNDAFDPGEFNRKAR